MGANPVVHLAQIVGLVAALLAFAGGCTVIVNSVTEGKNWHEPIGPTVKLFIAIGGIGLGIVLVGEIAGLAVGTKGLFLTMFQDGFQAVGDAILSALKS